MLISYMDTLQNDYHSAVESANTFLTSCSYHLFFRGENIYNLLS